MLTLTVDVGELRLLRRSVLVYSDSARDAADYYAQKGPQSSPEKMRTALAEAKRLDELYAKLVALSP